MKFDFHSLFLRAFELLKMSLIEIPLLIASDWWIPFELVCDSRDVAVGAVLGQRNNRFVHTIIM